MWTQELRTKTLIPLTGVRIEPEMVGLLSKRSSSRREKDWHIKIYPPFGRYKKGEYGNSVQRQ